LSFNHIDVLGVQNSTQKQKNFGLEKQKLREFEGLLLNQENFLSSNRAKMWVLQPDAKNLKFLWQVFDNCVVDFYEKLI